MLATGNANVSDDVQAEIEALEVEMECGVITMEQYEQKTSALLQHSAPPVEVQSFFSVWEDICVRN